MLAKKYRLPIKESRGRLRKLFSSPYFLVKCAENSSGRNRLAIIIAVSSVKSSVGRHFWKRRFADVFGKWPNLKKDFLFIVSPKIKTLVPLNLKTEMDKVLVALNPIKEPKT